jgi:F0F1-type ATP synthase assembly protein I
VAGPQGSQERRVREGLSSYGSALQKAGPFMSAGFSLAASVGVFAWLGYKVDGWVGTKHPWFLIAGAVIGMVGGFISFFRLVLGLDKASKLSRGGKPPENEEPRA